VQRSVIQYIVFVLVLSAILGAVHYYLWLRLVRAPDLGERGHRIGTWIVIALAITTPVGLFVSRLLPRTASVAVSNFVYLWIGLAFLLLVLLAASEVVRTAAHGVSLLETTPAHPDRRTFLSRAIAGAVAFLAVGLAGTGTASALGEVAVRPIRVGLRRFPAALSGFRIAQITDVHIGPTLGRSFLAAVVERVNALDPDIIVITGDLVDGSVASLREHTAPLADLKARHGVFFVTGNHEYYSGVDEWIAELTRLGVRVLRNERVSIGTGEASFDLAGVDDWSTRGRKGPHRADLAAAVAGRDTSRELVLLAHQPKHIVEAAEMGVGLQLSGHTHGGQIFPWGWFVKLDQPYVAGLSQHGDTQIYVSCGTGFWGPPMRVGAPAEITLIEIEPASPI
jgi:uncharacterized protein